MDPMSMSRGEGVQLSWQVESITIQVPHFCMYQLFHLVEIKTLMSKPNQNRRFGLSLQRPGLLINH